MTADPTPLAPEEIERIYQTLIRPTLFEPPLQRDIEAAPTLVLLGGQPGAGKSRASARISTEHDGQVIALSGDDLRIFHPDYRRLITDEPEQAGPILAEATRAWVRAAIQDAFETRHSFLLEGTFSDPATTLATADRFRRAGFKVRIVAVASPRVLSIITAASRYLRDLKMGAPARFTRLSAHDRGYHGTTRLFEDPDLTNSADRVTILSRNGHVLFDRSRDRDNTVAFAEAKATLQKGRHPESWGARSTMELLGELKQITGYAINSGQLTPDIADLLVEAHQLSLSEVVPHLSVDADAPQARFIGQAVTEQLVALRRASGAEQFGPVDVMVGPDVSPAELTTD